MKFRCHLNFIDFRNQSGRDSPNLGPPYSNYESMIATSGTSGAPSRSRRWWRRSGGSRRGGTAAGCATSSSTTATPSRRGAAAAAATGSRGKGSSGEAPFGGTSRATPSSAFREGGRQRSDSNGWMNHDGGCTRGPNIVDFCAIILVGLILLWLHVQGQDCQIVS